MKRLPEVRVPGYFNTWPKIVYEFADLVEQEPPRLSRPRPSPAAISRMEETMDWLKWLEPVDAKIVWHRASGERWKIVCWKAGLARAAAHEHWQYALCVVAWHLNGRRPPSERLQAAPHHRDQGCERLSTMAKMVRRTLFAQTKTARLATIRARLTRAACTAFRHGEHRHIARQARDNPQTVKQAAS